MKIQDTDLSRTKIHPSILIKEYIKSEYPTQLLKSKAAGESIQTQNNFIQLFLDKKANLLVKMNTEFEKENSATAPLEQHIIAANHETWSEIRNLIDIYYSH